MWKLPNVKWIILCPLKDPSWIEKCVSTWIFFWIIELWSDISLILWLRWMMLATLFSMSSLWRDSINTKWPDATMSAYQQHFYTWFFKIIVKMNKRHITSVHEGRSYFNALLLVLPDLKISTWKCAKLQFMKERSHLNALIVVLLLQKKVNWNCS